MTARVCLFLLSVYKLLLMSSHTLLSWQPLWFNSLKTPIQPHFLSLGEIDLIFKETLCLFHKISYAIQSCFCISRLTLWKTEIGTNHTVWSLSDVQPYFWGHKIQKNNSIYHGHDTVNEMQDCLLRTLGNTQKRKN